MSSCLSDRMGQFVLESSFNETIPGPRRRATALTYRRVISCAIVSTQIWKRENFPVWEPTVRVAASV